MGKYLQDLDLYMPPSEGEESRQWALSTNFLEILYLDSLPKVETPGVSKIIIRPCRELPTILNEGPSKYLPVIQLYKLFDFDNYWNSSIINRKRIALDLMQGALLELADFYGWDKNSFNQAYLKVLALNFVNYRPWTKSVSCPNKKFKSQVWCNYDSEKADIFVVIFSRNKEIHKSLVTSVKPGDVFIRRAAANLLWTSSNEIQLTNYDGSESWNVIMKA